MTAPPGAESLSIVFVCHANICRSPMAEAVFRHLVVAEGFADRFRIDSAGVMALEGAAPHPLTVETCDTHGIKAAGTARQLLRNDLFHTDHIVLADSDNLRRLQQMMGPSAFGKMPETRARIRLLRGIPSDPPESSVDLFDPARGGAEQFEECLTVVERCCRALLHELA